MAIVFVVEKSGDTPVALSEPLRREGYHVVSLRSPDEAVEALHEMRADLLVIDARREAFNYAPLFGALCEQPFYVGLPIFVVGTGIAEFRCVGTSPRSVQPAAVVGEDQRARPLLNRVRSQLAPLTAQFN